MATWREPALVLGIGLEAIAVAALVDDAAARAAAAHLASCAGIACGLARRLPAPAGRLAFAMALFLPVAGALGCIVAAFVTPRAETPRGRLLVRTPVPGPEAARIHATREVAPVWSASLRVAAARRRDDPEAIDLLRRALGDPDEDVRLVAHAVLESKHRGAYRSLHDAARSLEAAPPLRRAALHRRLAAEHWELARIGLAEGECLAHALEQARQHASAALAAEPALASMWLLLGRIELRRGDARAAEDALSCAVERGLPPAIATPYLAEAAFLERRFDRVRDRLADPPPDGALHRVWRYWA